MFSTLLRKLQASKWIEAVYVPDSAEEITNVKMNISIFLAFVSILRQVVEIQPHDYPSTCEATLNNMDNWIIPSNL